jgi:hypothetical protein
MYQIILDQIIDDMQSFGIISTIIISGDYYSTLTKKEVAHLESLIDSETLKWLIVNDKKQYFSFRYSHEPIDDLGFDPLI